MPMVEAAAPPKCDLNTLSVTALLHLEIREVTAKPLEVQEDLFLTNHLPTIEKLLQPENLRPVIGNLEMDVLLSGKPILMKQSHLDQPDQVRNELLTFLYTVQAFTDSFWLEVDCSVASELAFTIYHGRDSTRVDSNFLAVKYSNSAGTSVNMSLTIPMVRRACRRYFARIQPIMPDFDQRSKLVKPATRFQIANHHFHAARSADTLELKLASYCSGFEAMLSTAITELAHQLSERVAVLLGDRDDSRLELYRTMKRIYAIRSKVVHGSYISQAEQADLPALCREADSWARQLARRYLEDGTFQTLTDNRDNEKIDNYFLNLILQKSDSVASTFGQIEESEERET